ncbi:pyridoxamine 5'-phosphate oxidase family protein [Streptomyces montanisoli]|uniref:Pyridoxamine 5'-phosphate oxidase family protein n=1 Tax=Streptomyces montanisoli TaxID=2798581 RepID=A0A940M783_9ACTN|nr:pyridoxamine 5'-phosphate oxidase family protein [Streptomyces montanisoli]MBP0457455.1 pyridoxamine 5'-phosphate oxidase family protein [Streptomyces montanisoli]
MPTEAPDVTEATALLARVPYGRLAATLRAMPFVAPARHVVLPGALLLRMHAGLGYHRACSGSVVAYGADNLAPGSAAQDQEPRWSVQCIGTAVTVRPTDEESALFGPEPLLVDGERFDAVYLRIVPRLTSVHRLLPRGSGERPSEHAASTTI